MSFVHNECGPRDGVEQPSTVPQNLETGEDNIKLGPLAPLTCLGRLPELVLVDDLRPDRSGLADFNSEFTSELA